MRPTPKETVEFARWVRDAVDHCNVPIYFLFIEAKTPTLFLHSKVTTYTNTRNKTSPTEKPDMANVAPSTTHRNNMDDLHEAPTPKPTTSEPNTIGRAQIQAPIILILLLITIITVTTISYYRKH